MKTRLLYIILALTCLMSGSPLYATHLVGGSMSYEYMFQLNNGKIRYRVTLNMYRDCRASQVQFDDVIQVSVHHNNTNRTLYKSFSVDRLSRNNVDPPSGGSNCAFKPDVCLERGFYQAEIDLDPTTVGYHLVFQRCCRNTQNNILDDLGQTYYSFIPPTSIRNSSPYFTGVPAPYICINDLVNLDNAAKDPDGDSLVYSLVTPWSGADKDDPMPAPVTNWPQIPNFDNVIYKSGHSVAAPFGAGGTAKINSRNGLTDLLSPKVGRYSIAIEVKEYRNGVFLSRIRLDIQLIVENCTPNKVPTITPNSGTYSYEVFAGQKLCFDLTIADADNHKLKMSGSGSIFDLPNKPTFSNTTGSSPLSTTFCWTPTCNDVSNIPYIFNIDAIDDGCPPKKRVEAFSILVKEFIGVQDFTGPSPVCAASKTLYVANGGPGSTYNWSLSPSSAGIITGNGQKQISVEWLTPGSASLTVTEVSSANCQGKPFSKNINIIPNPATPFINGKDTVCEFSSGNTYGIPPTSGHTYFWSVSGGSISAGNGTSNITVNWGAEGNGMISLIQINSLGCPSDTGFFPVAIVKSRIDSLYGSPSVCPNIKGVEYKVLNPLFGATYIWTIQGGTQASGGNSPDITVNWGGPSNGYVEVYAINKFGCVSEPQRMNVRINHELLGMIPSGPDTLCEFTAGIKYEVIYTQGSTYYWSIQNGTIVQDDKSNSVIVNWGSAGTGKITVSEVSFDSVGNLACLSKPLTLEVFIAPIPVDNGIQGPDEICQTPLEELYYVKGFPGSTFNWTFTGPSIIRGQGNDSVYLTLNTPGNFTLIVTETSQFGCEGPAIDKNVLIHPKPVTKGIFGDSVVCFPEYSNKLYNVSGYANSVFNWAINGGIITTGQGGSNISIDWSGQQLNKLSVFEVSEFNCYGDTLTLDVFADNPSIDLKVVSVGEPDDRMEIKWDLINGPRYNSTFDIYRREIDSTGKSSQWINRFSVNATERTFTDKPINTDNHPYEYMIVGKNLCGVPLNSDIHRNVFLLGNKGEEGYDVYVNWTRYLGWTDGVKYYELYRRNGKEQYVLLAPKGDDTSDYYDDGMKSFEHCYRVKSYELNGSGEVSWSNDVCFKFEPLLWIPNAFTNNGDHLNQNFQLKGASIKTFNMEIYNRWGELIFTSDNFEYAWDGTYRGKPVPEGVYVYIIRYSGADDRLINKKGNITLLR